MSFIFGANASRTAKVFTVFVYLSFIAVFYGAFTNIAPTGLVQENWIYPALALTLLYSSPLVFARRTNKPPRVLSLQTRIFGYFGWCLLSFCLAAWLTVYSFPSIFTALMGQPYEFSSVVERKDENLSLRTWGCPHEIELKDFGYGIREDVCVESSLWELIKEGDMVYIESSKSALGIKITDINIER
jgi:hypothetical protein